MSFRFSGIGQAREESPQVKLTLSMPTAASLSAGTSGGCNAFPFAARSDAHLKEGGLTCFVLQLRSPPVC
jgi:hypothetical protein